MKSDTHKLVFLTGCTGLVGGHFLVHLYQSGYHIRGLVRSTSSFDQLRLICAFYNQSFDELYDSVEWVCGDTLDYVGLCEWMAGVEDVYHCAAVVSFNSKNSRELLRTNIQGTSNMVDAALKCGIKRFCFISSIGALGHAKKGDFVHENTPRKSNGESSVYSESKFQSELEVWRASNEGLNTVILNPGIILGPGTPNKGSLLLIQTGRKGMPFYTKATTGYVDVRDVCRAGIELMRKNIFGKHFILVSENIDNKELFSMIASEFNKKPPRFLAGKTILHLGAFLSEIYGKISGKVPQLTRETVETAQKPQKYSNQQIRSTLDFNFIPLRQTIREICDFLKENKI
ncbi:MAG: NAD-dependent epimerase/dehydratase family protein [Bacteroidales bacterium]|nr:NAD-dependent epimerase/dehydratase family protein [Bacteroidales bacterium]MDD3906793.1 NAD-dependent epimerase/dehydratase family protein [Bacteroidales bacterium]MDD4712164.1 NAD-dependent epimerase/dehydratase family protein [Bacteroidales bacterium]